MPKKRAKNDTEYYKGIIRKLRKQVQQLRRLIETAGNNYGTSLEEHELTEDLERQPKEQVQMCPSCHRHPLRDFEVLGRKFKICENCAWRSVPDRTDKK